MNINAAGSYSSFQHDFDSAHIGHHVSSEKEAVKLGKSLGLEGKKLDNFVAMLKDETNNFRNDINAKEAFDLYKNNGNENVGGGESIDGVDHGSHGGAEKIGSRELHMNGKTVDPNGCEYIIVTTSHGNGDADELQDRFLLDCGSNCELVGYTGGDDKVIFLVKVKDPNEPVSFDSHPGGGTKIVGLETGGKKLSISGGEGVKKDASFDAPGRGEIAFGASDGGKSSGSTVYGKGSDDPLSVGYTESYKTRGAFMIVKIH